MEKEKPVIVPAEDAVTPSTNQEETKEECKDDSSENEEFHELASETQEGPVETKQRAESKESFPEIKEQ